MRPDDQRKSKADKDGSKVSEKSHRYSARRSASGVNKNQQR